MITYDERDLVGRLSGLGRESKTFFAVLCAEMPLYRRYVDGSGDGDLEVLRGIVERVGGCSRIRAVI
ncbi:hypothetical protein GCM10009630_41160 [Kribbella jejuensis]|uniref:hypothetical protein n=1 Tax=Kribbella jejuensis TaxID=236068 RepID=UPI00114DE612|nr:hypothetical protein [Kribbella jejuensis]